MRELRALVVQSHPERNPEAPGLEGKTNGTRSAQRAVPPPFGVLLRRAIAPVVSCGAGG